MMSQKDVKWYYDEFDDKPTVFLIDYIDEDTKPQSEDPSGQAAGYGKNFVWVGRFRQCDRSEKPQYRSGLTWQPRCSRRPILSRRPSSSPSSGKRDDGVRGLWQ
jgi:hypothetical protein